MIIVKLSAGLGNQMFQYALGRRLSLDWGDELLFDSSWFYSTREGETPRELELHKFHLLLPEAHPADIEKAKPCTFIKIVKKVKARLDKNVFYRFNKTLLKKRKYVYLDGYFQSYKYFESIRETLLTDFILTDGYSDDAYTTKQEIERVGESVSIHIRRGDFASTCKTWNGLCSIDYYQKALATIQKTHPLVTVFIFSDDIKWAKENLYFDAVPMVFVSRPSLSATEELSLMSLCKHQIIANSTFSWWAAWLNKNVEKIVVAPSRWLVVSNIDTVDLLPPNWIQI